VLEEAEDEELGDAVHEVRVGLAGGHAGTIHRGSRYTQEKFVRNAWADVNWEPAMVLGQAFLDSEGGLRF
jgi:hypothetical protein